MTRKQSAHKFSNTRQLNKGQLEIDPSDRKAALLKLPLKTHIDMVTLTLDNLDLKLSAMREANDERSETHDQMIEVNDAMNAAKQSALNAQDFELLKRLSERLMAQRVRIDDALQNQSSLRRMQ